MSHVGVGNPCNCGEDGWMPGVEHAPIRWTQPPMTHRTMTPLAVVDHIMQGFLSTMVRWASNGESKVIVHFGIDRSGRIVQFHPVHKVGRHVSAINSPASAIVRQEGQHSQTTGANGYTIGIEHEGCSVRPPYNVPASLIYSPSNPWPDAMVEASIRVKRWCFENVPSLGPPSRRTVIGHYEVDARNRPDDPASRANRSVWPVSKMLEALGTSEEGYVDREYTVVRKGEWLSKVAQRVGLSVDRLAELNEIADPDDVKAGQALRLTEEGDIFPWPEAGEPPDVSKLITGGEQIQRIGKDIVAEARRIGGGS